MIEPGFMLSTISCVISTGAGRPGIKAVGDDHVLVLHMLGDEARLLGLVLAESSLA